MPRIPRIPNNKEVLEINSGRRGLVVNSQNITTVFGKKVLSGWFYTVKFCDDKYEIVYYQNVIEII